MTETEILDFYNENWNDYNKIVDMLHNVLDKHEEEIKELKQKLNTRPNKNNSNDEIKELKSLLQQCQDNLDEETHKL